MNQQNANFSGSDQAFIAQYQNFLNMNAPTLVVTPSNIPLYPGSGGPLDQNQMPKYNQLLAVFEEMKRDIRPIYSGSKSAAERFKRGILHSRILIKEISDELKK